MVVLRLKSSAGNSEGHGLACVHRLDALKGGSLSLAGPDACASSLQTHGRWLLSLGCGGPHVRLKLNVGI